MSGALTVRRGTPADNPALGEVMFDAVRNGPSLYTPAQQAAWVPEPRGGTDWDERLARQCVFLAEQAGLIQGFLTLDPPDYVDFAYIRPDCQGKGLFRRLHDALEQEAGRRKLSGLHVHASLMARPAFLVVGYQVTAEETVELRGEHFRRFAMQKVL
ncbi:GNAT family N-acetyltransferase [Maricaulis sp.]|uniref:GNAT family N-acetyltransferase n=1 Tax=Maricaulis sp. TaxID=1486257 RepID=UPI002B266A80|nr:GNAT family N-acetyltransferase [Maricaulis sp.]